MKLYVISIDLVTTSCHKNLPLTIEKMQCNFVIPLTDCKIRLTFSLKSHPIPRIHGPSGTQWRCISFKGRLASWEPQTFDVCSYSMDNYLRLKMLNILCCLSLILYLDAEIPNCVRTD